MHNGVWFVESLEICDKPSPLAAIDLAIYVEAHLAKSFSILTIGFKGEDV